MPISKENKKLYPKNWKELRKQVLERANNRCEFCGLENHSMVERTRSDRHGGTETVLVKVVLTIAHLDQDPTHNDLSNLKALCQKCHLAYDKEQHKRNAAATIERKKREALEAAGQLKLNLEQL